MRRRRYGTGIDATILGAQTPGWCVWRAKDDWGRVFLVPARREVYRHRHSIRMASQPHFDALVEVLAAPAPADRATLERLNEASALLAKLHLGVSLRYNTLIGLPSSPPPVVRNPKPGTVKPPRPSRPPGWARLNSKKPWA